MDKTKEIHYSGPLGMLLREGEIKPVSLNNTPDIDRATNKHALDRVNPNAHLQSFQTKSGIEFSENELVDVDPEECEPWQYANRSSQEMGEIQELIQSIKNNKQLQPGLIRQHPNPHGKIKYEIIFGRRRHLACLELKIPFLAIKRVTLSNQDAIVCQDAENKFRKNVSNYSNALLYKRLINDGTFSNEKQLAQFLNISASNLSELLNFAKIPEDLVLLLPDVHKLSTAMAIKIVSLLNFGIKAKNILIKLAPEIGSKINSSNALEKRFQMQESSINEGKSLPITSTTFESKNGKKMFTLRLDQKGAACLVFNKKYSEQLDFDKLCLQIKNFIDLVD
ncbi:MAG: ParB/RepB/Spo0J family partition protein [Gammaproteobacteria bacterium]